MPRLTRSVRAAVPVAVLAAALVSVLVTGSPAETPEDRGATVDLGDPVRCTADLRHQVTTVPFAVPQAEPATPRRLDRPGGYVLADSLESTIFVGAGEEYVIRFEQGRQALNDTLLPYTLTPTMRAGIEVAPAWLRLDLEQNIRTLSAVKQDGLGELLLGLGDPRTVDEVAFAMAHLSKAVLTHGDFQPELLEINAELMYQIDPELAFVEIIDYDLGEDSYSTTRYRTVVAGDTVEIEIPSEIYYWWVAMPKVSDEMTLMNASVYDMFWREYLYYEHDEGYPLLRDVVAPLEVLWDGGRHDWPGGRAFTDSMLAVDAVGTWCSETVPFAASGNRPIQPSQIAHEHNGNCGEMQDLLCAAARTCLIPCACAMDILEDHVWCEMWLEDWHPYQIDLGGGTTHIANPGIAYDVDYGGSKNVSCIWSWRNDGYTYDVVSRYSETCTLSVYVDDPNGLPVDNAAVVIASESYYAPYALRRGTWGETDRDGTIQFVVGDAQNYYIQVTTSMGTYPASGYALIISESVPGEHYYWSWTAPEPAPGLDITELPPVTDAPYVIEAEYDLPYDVLNGPVYYGNPTDWYAVNLPEGQLEFFIVSPFNFVRYYLFGNPFDAYEVAHGLTSNHVQFHVPSTEDFSVVLSGGAHHGVATLANVKARLWLNDTVGVPEGADVAVTSLAQPFPNPFTPGARLAFTLAREGSVTLAVYDVRGALVRVLEDGIVEPGAHERAWDGRDGSGHPVASGVYFARMVAAGDVESRKLVLLR